MLTVFAAEPIVNPALGKSYQTMSGSAFLQDILTKAISIAFIIGIIAFFFVLIFGAISWITSGGDKGSVEDARRRITAGLVGIFILLSLYGIIGLVENIFKVNLLLIDLGALGIAS